MLEIKLTLSSKSELNALIAALETFADMEAERTKDPEEFKNKAEHLEAVETYKAGCALLKRIK